MKKINTTVLNFCLALLVPATCAAASTSTSALYDISASTATDSHNAFSQVEYNNGAAMSSGGSQAMAQAATGFVSASSAYTNGPGMNYENYIDPNTILPSGTAENISFMSIASWEETYIASSTGAYSWHTSVSGAGIHYRYDTFANILPVSRALSTGFEGVVTVNGTEVKRFGTRINDLAGSRIVWGMDGSSSSSVHAGDPTFIDAYSSWSPFGFDTSLGLFNEGELITVGLSVSTFAQGQGLNNGVEVFIGDPGDLTGGGVTGVLTPESLTLNTVPIPSAFWLLGSGLLGLVAVARRKV